MQSKSYTKNLYGPFKSENDANMKIEPTFIRFAHFLGDTTIIGRKSVARNRKKQPSRKKATKYGYIILYSYVFCTKSPDF